MNISLVNDLCSGWIGFGLGTSMNNADMIIGAANDTSVTVGTFLVKMIVTK